MSETKQSAEAQDSHVAVELVLSVDGKTLPKKRIRELALAWESSGNAPYGLDELADEFFEAGMEHLARSEAEREEDASLEIPKDEEGIYFFFDDPEGERQVASVMFRLESLPEWLAEVANGNIISVSEGAKLLADKYQASCAVQK